MVDRVFDHLLRRARIPDSFRHMNEGFPAHALALLALPSAVCRSMPMRMLHLFGPVRQDNALFNLAYPLRSTRLTWLEQHASMLIAHQQLKQKHARRYKVSV